MKLTITNKTGVILANILRVRFFIWFSVWFILGFLIFGLSGIINNVSPTAQWVTVFLLPFIYLLYVIIDSYTYATNAYIELKDNSIDIYFKNLIKQGHITLPTAQIESINIAQPFKFRILGISIINFLQESGVITISAGYNYNIASKFAQDFGNKYKVRIGK
jgi:hypothetical protein